MDDPEVVRFLRQRKKALLMGEQAEMRALAQRWLKVEQALKSEMEALAAQLASSAFVNDAMLLKHERYIKLMYQARAEVAKFNDFADGRMIKMQETLGKQGIEDAMRALKIMHAEAGVVMPGFNKLPVRSLEIMFGYAADGSPLRSLLTRAYPEAVNGLTEALINGLAAGKNPIDVGRMMTEEFGVGLNKALTIARTETLRAYRTGSMEQYRESGIVTGYKRLATQDERTCPGCLFRDGEMIESLDADFDEHPNGRCTAVPVVSGVPEPTWQSGTQWFTGQPEATQREMLGNERYELWQSGVDLSEMSKKVNDPTWGGSYVPTPVGELKQ